MKINVGNGYYLNLGVFIVLEIGYYVFSWMLRIKYYGSMGEDYVLEFIING